MSGMIARQYSILSFASAGPSPSFQAARTNLTAGCFGS